MTDLMGTGAGATGQKDPIAPASRIAIAGASGYVGRLLAKQMAEAGHQVLALARHTDTLPVGERISGVAVDVADPEATARALAGTDAAYYLVHAMAGGSGFEARDRELAAAFGRAARAAGVGRIIYLGGLGRGDLSAHLDSRQEVGAVLAASGLPVVELRAAVILGPEASRTRCCARSPSGCRSWSARAGSPPGSNRWLRATCSTTSWEHLSPRRASMRSARLT